ncbi:MAG: hypothetical protein ICV68_10470 [Pyrinomonadaceae bacterium]|nr:hypothetical protein [Pyrinomonadaceae bacterium]
MRKLFIAALIVAAAFIIAPAQQETTQQSLEEITRLARAPQQPDGMGRAVILVSDKDGNPIGNAYAKLESVWGGDQFCESWGSTNSIGALALNPIHMGKLKLMVKAKGYQTQKIEVDASTLSEPVRVTLARK